MRGGGVGGWGHWEEKGAPPSSCRKSTIELVSQPEHRVSPSLGVGGVAVAMGVGKGLMVADTDVA